MTQPARYIVDGVPFISVTEVLREAGLVDFSMVPAGLLEAARIRGTRVHRLTELIDRGDTQLDVDDDMLGYVDAYERFRKEVPFEIQLIEKEVWSKHYRYAGRVDRVGLLNGHPSILDYKTGLTVEWWEGLQLAGYEVCLANYPTVIKPDVRHRRYALHLRPDGTYKLVRFESRSDRPDFLAAVRIANLRRRHA